MDFLRTPSVGTPDEEDCRVTPTPPPTGNPRAATGEQVAIAQVIADAASMPAKTADKIAYRVLVGSDAKSPLDRSFAAEKGATLEAAKYFRKMTEGGQPVVVVDDRGSEVFRFENGKSVAGDSRMTPNFASRLNQVDRARSVNAIKAATVTPPLPEGSDTLKPGLAKDPYKEKPLPEPGGLVPARMASSQERQAENKRQAAMLEEILRRFMRWITNMVRKLLRLPPLVESASFQAQKDRPQPQIVLADSLATQGKEPGVAPSAPNPAVSLSQGKTPSLMERVKQKLAGLLAPFRKDLSGANATAPGSTGAAVQAAQAAAHAGDSVSREVRNKVVSAWRETGATPRQHAIRPVKIFVAGRRNQDYVPLVRPASGPVPESMKVPDEPQMIRRATA